MAKDIAFEDAPDDSPDSTPIDVGQARFFSPCVQGLASERIRPIIFCRTCEPDPTLRVKRPRMKCGIHSIAYGKGTR